MSQAPYRLVGAGLGCLAGTGWQLQASAVQAPMVRWAVLAVVLFVALGWWLRTQSGQALGSSLVRGLLAFGVSACLAWCAADWRAGERLAERLNPSLEGLDLQIDGTVIGLPQRRSDGLRFDFAPAVAGSKPVPSRLRLGWYASARGNAAALPVLRPGERWRLRVRLKQVHGHVNPHGFDYELLLFEQGVGATGSVRSGERVAPAQTWQQPVDRLRYAVREAVFQRLGDTPAAGVLAALSIGDQAAIDRDDWAVFRLTGVAHLVAISGMHVTMFAWLAGGLIAALWRRLGSLPLVCPTPAVGRWGGVWAAAAYALLAGWGVPAQRTVWMLVVAAGLRSQARRWPWPLVLGAAGCTVVLLDPWALLQPGFWLSFVAVAVLMADGSTSSSTRTPVADRSVLARMRHWLGTALRTQLLVTVALAPLSLMFFQQMSMVGLLANLVAIPVVTVLVIPLALGGVVWPALWSLGSAVLDWGMRGLVALAAWPWAAWYGAAAPPALWCLAWAGLLALVLPWPRRMRLLGLIAVLPVFLHTPERPPMGEFDLLAADIGQGNAVLLRTARHNILYDSGPQYGADSDAGERVLVPLLRSLGIRSLDLLMLSHRDADHVGGARSLLQALQVHRIQSSLEAGHPLRLAAPHQPCSAGQAWQWEGVQFEVLHPSAQVLADNEARRGRSNARSCVLRVQGRHRAALLVGDIEALEEMRLVAAASAGRALAADVLLVPHHGSRTSSTPEFIAAVHPKWALVQAGYRNRFGHPAPSVLQRYEDRGIVVVRTDSCGAWHWRSATDANWCERGREARYWQSLQGTVGLPGARMGRTVTWP